MEIKLFEVRDRATFVPVIAVKLGPDNSERERYLLARAGFGTDRESQGTYVVLAPLVDLHRATYDPYDWGSARTYPVVHQRLIEHWADYESGAVIDVEHILGETPEPKRSEQETVPY